MEVMTQNLNKSYRLKQKNSLRRLNLIKTAINMEDDEFDSKVGKKCINTLKIGMKNI